MSDMHSWQRYRALASVLLLTAVLLLLVRYTSLGHHFTLNAVRAQLSGAQWQGLLLFGLLFVLGNLLHIPGLIFLGSAVLVLGRVEGGLITYVAACVSCAITFLGVRLVGGNALFALRNPLAQRLLRQLHTHPLRSMVLLRTVFQTMPTLNYTLALSGISFGRYMLATLIGLPLPITAYCLFFDYVARSAGLT